ncbi:MAG: hypothetical protein JOZ83_15600 [Silvibacterium sp.]|nr:hypothetical protein [Silvibacterium sp.]
MIKFVADPSLDNPDTQWYVNEFGGGVMVAHERLGPVFIDDPESDGDLELVDRADAGN